LDPITEEKSLIWFDIPERPLHGTSSDAVSEPSGTVVPPRINLETVAGGDRKEVHFRSAAMLIPFGDHGPAVEAGIATFLGIEERDDVARCGMVVAL
jgi:hypothetical protein